ncbi:MAG: ABC transporter substrate-binding protein [Arenibacterium sp.]
MSRLDRRALFTSGAAAALLAAAGISAQAAPRPGGHLRIAVPRDGSLISLVRGAVLETLTEIAPDGTLKGQLAQAWRALEKGRVWEFDLTESAVFHDGTRFDALAARDALVKLNVGVVDALGERGVRIALTRENPDFPLRLAESELGVFAGTETVVGTGPYRVKRLDAERGALLEKVTDHPAPGWADRVEVTVIPDPGVRAEALLDGFVDIAYLPEPERLVQEAKLQFHPSAKDIALAANDSVGMPQTISLREPLDDGRLARRWWVV